MSASPRVSVIIPALNECESIGHVVASMPWHAIAECIVVDNGSTDGTGGVAAAAGARVITSPRGYGQPAELGQSRIAFQRHSCPDGRRWQRHHH